MVYLRVLLLALSAVALFAQDYRAKIQGIVTDSTEAAVAGAKVTIQNKGTGILATRETGANGAYLFDNVEPGTYLVTAEFQGFSKQVQDNVLVQFQSPSRSHGRVGHRLGPGSLLTIQHLNSRTHHRP
jgi:hypothetical protein